MDVTIDYAYYQDVYCRDITVEWRNHHRNLFIDTTFIHNSRATSGYCSYCFLNRVTTRFIHNEIYTYINETSVNKIKNSMIGISMSHWMVQPTRFGNMTLNHFYIPTLISRNSMCFYFLLTFIS